MVPNGIDDCREALNGGFLAFWEGIKAEAVEVPVEDGAETIATELLIPQLHASGN